MSKTQETPNPASRHQMNLISAPQVTSNNQNTIKMGEKTLPTRELDLIGKVAVISGASRGIGRAIAFNLASRGCSILGTCVSNKGIDALSSGLNDEITERIYKATSRERPAGQQIKGIIADVFSSDCAKTIADALEKSFGGRVDILVNSAGDPMPGVIGQMATEEIQRSILGNVQTPVQIVEELVRRKLFQLNSRIIYISSVRSRLPWADQLMYAAGKSAVTAGLTETDAVMDCGPEVVKTFQDEFFPLQSIPKFGQPDDVADVVGMLCGNDGRWITGSVISASGGCIKMQ
ncbi:3-oxoacyl-[acyl-carrier-protein] reductase FabG [Fusarium odoratissimum]|uniref:3-oxoacyl-[acyl-carrier-protein] reductase n=1 Tax=Fusarium oxysporum f. sp. cubense (strain race 4) TaxID=2502994 RepID=N1RSC3_FUSC4|nr:3-oxoacyl-[acyl-carrier-protein] reductase FabG [Fusarium odoratissimum]